MESCMREGLGGTQCRWLPGGGQRLAWEGSPGALLSGQWVGDTSWPCPVPPSTGSPGCPLRPPSGGGRSGEGVIPGAGYPLLSRQRAATSPHIRG